MLVHLAQNTVVSYTRDFVSIRERDEILAVVSRCQLPIYTSNYSEDVDTTGNPIHTTMYMQTNNIFETKLKWLHRRIVNLVTKVNNANDWGFDINAKTLLNVRVAEYHEMFERGSLSDSQHYDIGSIITVDIMLEEAKRGALFQTLESVSTNMRSCTQGEDICKDTDNTLINIVRNEDKVKTSLKHHPFHVGDALVFVSHKYHCVSELLEGRRKVLVVELWSGKKRTCGHRCDDPMSKCTFIDS